MRLGTFIMSYLAFLSATVITMAITGIQVSFGLIIALVPLAIFIALRLSGFLCPHKKEEE